MKLWGGKAFPGNTFTLLTKDGIPVVWEGAYVIVDGGYQKMASFIDPMHNRFGFKEILWSEWLESVRKDVECTFGILKIRFRLLRNPVIYQCGDTISNAFKTACLLHNMLLVFDGLNDILWDEVHPDGDEDVYDEGNIDVQLQHDDLLDPTILLNVIPVAVIPVVEKYHQYNYSKLRESLVDHFNYKYSLGEIYWPKKFTTSQRDRFPINHMENIVDRVNLENTRLLYIQASSLRGQDRRTGLYTELIGEGLFSNISYIPTQTIVEYVGAIITHEEGFIREQAGRGGYMIHLNDAQLLDCYDACQDGRCLASKANSATNCYNTVLRRKAVANSSIVVGYLQSGNYRVRIIAQTNIASHHEIITRYGRAYRYPATH